MHPRESWKEFLATLTPEQQAADPDLKWLQDNGCMPPESYEPKATPTPPQKEGLGWAAELLQWLRKTA